MTLLLPWIKFTVDSSTEKFTEVAVAVLVTTVRPVWTCVDLLVTTAWLVHRSHWSSVGGPTSSKWYLPIVHDVCEHERIKMELCSLQFECNFCAG